MTRCLAIEHFPQRAHSARNISRQMSSASVSAAPPSPYANPSISLMACGRSKSRRISPISDFLHQAAPCSRRSTRQRKSIRRSSGVGAGNCPAGFPSMVGNPTASVAYKVNTATKVVVRAIRNLHKYLACKSNSVCSGHGLFSATNSKRAQPTAM